MRTYAESLRNLLYRFRKAFTNEKVFIVIGAFLAALLIAGILFFVLMENIPFADAFYYSVNIMTGLGASDYHPKTAAAKLFTACYAFVSVSLYIGFITGLAQAIIISEHNKEK